MRALIVDDSGAMRMILKKMLGECGIESRLASNGQEALDLLFGGDVPDFVLVDWAMPEMDGFGFVISVRTRLEFTGLKIIMVTSESNPDNIRRAFAVGADEYLVKPFTREQFRRKLLDAGLDLGPVLGPDLRELPNRMTKETKRSPGFPPLGAAS